MSSCVKSKLESNSKDNVASGLMNKGVDESIINRFTEALNVCEYARYAPGEDYSQKEKVYADAASIISDLEQKI